MTEKIRLSIFKYRRKIEVPLFKELMMQENEYLFSAVLLRRKFYA